MDLCVGLDVIIAGTMDAMAGITDAAAVVDVVITTDAAAGFRQGYWQGYNDALWNRGSCGCDHDGGCGGCGSNRDGGCGGCGDSCN